MQRRGALEARVTGLDGVAFALQPLVLIGSAAKAGIVGYAKWLPPANDSPPRRQFVAPDGDEGGACRNVSNDGPRAGVRAAVKLNPESDDDPPARSPAVASAASTSGGQLCASVPRPSLLFILDRPPFAVVAEDAFTFS